MKFWLDSKARRDIQIAILESDQRVSDLIGMQYVLEQRRQLSRAAIERSYEVLADAEKRLTLFRSQAG